MATMKCPRCDSENIMPNLTVVDRVETMHDDFLAIEIDRKPDALVFKGTHRELMRAAVCGECGNVDLTVDNPKGLWETYSKRENS
ncbi:MAG: hypothetical protein OXM61_14670 [Candidatus Poribacteria bacterium]|nr:hypothetical protein [Candidatus Poribacteria bacterium]